MYSTLSRCLRLTPSGHWTTYWQPRISATYRMVFTRRSTRIPSRIFGSGSTPSARTEACELRFLDNVKKGYSDEAQRNSNLLQNTNHLQCAGNHDNHVQHGKGSYGPNKHV